MFTSINISDDHHANSAIRPVWKTCMRGSQEAGVVVCNILGVIYIYIYMYTAATVAVTGSRERNKSIKGFDVVAAFDDANSNRCAVDEVRGNYLFTYIGSAPSVFNAFALPSHPPLTRSLLLYTAYIYNI